MSCCKSFISFENCVVDGIFNINNFIEENRKTLSSDTIDGIQEFAAKYKIVGFDYDGDSDIIRFDYKDPEAVRYGCSPFGAAYFLR